jgi:hypothetical protein
MPFPSRGKNYGKENQEFQRAEYFVNYLVLIYLIGDMDLSATCALPYKYRVFQKELYNFESL